MRKFEIMLAWWILFSLLHRYCFGRKTYRIEGTEPDYVWFLQRHQDIEEVTSAFASVKSVLSEVERELKCSANGTTVFLATIFSFQNWTVSSVVGECGQWWGIILALMVNSTELRTTWEEYQRGNIYIGLSSEPIVSMKLIDIVSPTVGGTIP